METTQETTYERAREALRAKPRIAAQAKKNQGARGRKIQKPINTRKALAAVAGVSHDTIHKVEAIERDAPEAIKQKARAGEISIHRAYTLTRAAVEGSQHPIAGHVYLVRNDLAPNLCKIGITECLRDRFSAFERELPFPTTCVCLIKTDDARCIERGLHQEFAHARLGSSEWFWLSEEDVEFVKGLSSVI